MSPPAPEPYQSLTNPETSFRYGAAYLASQLETFDGNLYATLAAYNGGPSNAHRWLDEQQLPNQDGFVQVIDFEEIRHYAVTVVEQFSWYAYVLADTPSLP
jgi:soluble lytic murein transglycosylase